MKSSVQAPRHSSVNIAFMDLLVEHRKRVRNCSPCLPPSVANTLVVDLPPLRAMIQTCCPRLHKEVELL
ncbi:MAG: hypothetical protein LC751_03235 [Actinobacteria bacterium]|nr:hypothetical protein [Actinomycetota bacterium]MCA1739160.1 hypothetical protein [Actinomycetota bacterium]